MELRLVLGAKDHQSEADEEQPFAHGSKVARRYYAKLR
jgi:hypothetical protein